MRAADSVFSLALGAIGGSLGGEAVVILRAYVDESGTHGASELILGGYAGLMSRVQLFDRRWRAFLSAHRVVDYHTIDCRRGRRSFKGWDFQRRRSFLIEAEKLADEFFSFKFVLRLSVHAYKTLYAVQEKGIRFDSAYGLAFRALISTLPINIEEVVRRSVTLNLIVEHGHKNAPDLVRIFDEMKPYYADKRTRLGSLSFADKSVSGLHIADAIAYAGFRDTKTFRSEQDGGTAVRARYSKAEHGKCPLINMSPTEDTLTEFRQRALTSRDARQAWWSNQPASSDD